MVTPWLLKLKGVGRNAVGSHSFGIAFSGAPSRASTEGG